MGWTVGERVERGLVLDLVSMEHEEVWTRSELELVIYEYSPAIVHDAITRLERGGVVTINGYDDIRATAGVRYLDNVLGLVHP